MVVCGSTEDACDIWPEIEPPYTIEDSDSDYDEPRHGTLLGGSLVVPRLGLVGSLEGPWVRGGYIGIIVGSLNLSHCESIRREIRNPPLGVQVVLAGPEALRPEGY